MQVHRFQSPFSHWIVGLLVELAVFAGFITLIAVLVAVIVQFF